MNRDVFPYQEPCQQFALIGSFVGFQLRKKPINAVWFPNACKYLLPNVTYKIHRLQKQDLKIDGFLGTQEPMLTRSLPYLTNTNDFIEKTHSCLPSAGFSLSKNVVLEEEFWWNSRMYKFGQQTRNTYSDTNFWSK